MWRGTTAFAVDAGVSNEAVGRLALDELDRSVVTRDALLHCHGGAVAE
jgi:hypothetical protein